jgi:hypothetical protein
MYLGLRGLDLTMCWNSFTTQPESKKLYLPFSRGPYKTWALSLLADTCCKQPNFTSTWPTSTRKWHCFVPNIYARCLSTLTQANPMSRDTV